jgi:hypothetical protein
VGWTRGELKRVKENLKKSLFLFCFTGRHYICEAAKDTAERNEHATIIMIQALSYRQPIGFQSERGHSRHQGMTAAVDAL